jgi:predicted ATPase
MLKRLYIDNYKSLVNFELKPDYLCLLLGSNGSGKSAIFQVVAGIRSLLVENRSTTDVFPTSTRTRWEDRERQTFEIEVELSEQDRYCYHLEITHDLQKQSSRLSLETLQHNGKFLFTFEEGKVNIYDDFYQPGPDFYWDFGFTGLGRIPETRTTKKAARFMRWIDGAICVTIDPTRMKSLAETEDAHPSPRLENIAAWFRHLSQERMDDMKKLSDSLEDVIGLKSFALRMYSPVVRQLNSAALTTGRRRKEGSI